MAYKILFSGSFFSGKTTLANQLKEKGYNVIDEIAGPLIKEASERGDNGLKRRREFQLNLLDKQLAFETEAEKNHDLIICDRGVIDIVVYSKYYKHQFDWGNLLKDHSPYDTIFLCSIEGINASDKFTPTTLRKREILQELYFQTLDELDLSFEILMGDQEARLSCVQEVIKRWISVEGKRRSVER